MQDVIQFGTGNWILWYRVFLDNLLHSFEQVTQALLVLAKKSQIQEDLYLSTTSDSTVPFVRCPEAGFRWYGRPIAKVRISLAFVLFVVPPPTTLMTEFVLATLVFLPVLSFKDV